ncbi:MAG TPA: hydrolase TatD [Clostridiales bacterium]|nr:hydrolase TatD [Clostridiales bacterium]
MFFDTHAHYDSDAFDSDRHELLESLPAKGIAYVINPGCDEASSRTAAELAELYPFLYAAVGWHPGEWSSWTAESINTVRTLAALPKVVAIGEIGLDYYWDKTKKAAMRDMFAAQMALAEGLDLPVIIHDREAHGDCLEIMAQFPGIRGVLHCYSGSAEMAAELVRRGWYLGFDGPVTYGNARRAIESLAVCPLDRILIETDSPYLTPAPHRGERNDSSTLRFTAAKIAQVKGVAPEEIAAITLENGKRLFLGG